MQKAIYKFDIVFTGPDGETLELEVWEDPQAKRLFGVDPEFSRELQLVVHSPYITNTKIVTDINDIASKPKIINLVDYRPKQETDEQPGTGTTADGTSSKGLTCHICGKVCSSKSGMTLHLQRHEESQPEPEEFVEDGDEIVDADEYEEVDEENQ